MLYNVYCVSLVVAFLYCIYTYRQIDKTLKVFLICLSVGVLYESADMLGWTRFNHTNAWLANFEELFEFIIYTYFFTSLEKNRRYKSTVYKYACIVIVITIIDNLFIQGFWKLNTLAMVIQSLFVLLLIGIYYYKLLDKEGQIVLLRHPAFLVATGLLFYFLAKTFYYSCFSLMAYKSNYSFLILTRVILGLANLMLYTLLLYAFFCSSKATKLSLQRSEMKANP